MDEPMTPSNNNTATINYDFGKALSNYELQGIGKKFDELERVHRHHCLALKIAFGLIFALVVSVVTLLVTK